MLKLRPIVTVGGVIAGMGLLGACAGQSTPTPTTRQLTEADSGRSLALRLGDKLEITLPGNPTTGYQWEVGASDAAILRPIGEPLFVSGGGAIGSGGKVTLSFAAVGAGRLGLKLIYRRPFEKEVPPAQAFEVTVTVG